MALFRTVKMYGCVFTAAEHLEKKETSLVTFASFTTRLGNPNE